MFRVGIMSRSISSIRETLFQVIPFLLEARNPQLRILSARRVAKGKRALLSGLAFQYTTTDSVILQAQDSFFVAMAGRIAHLEN